MSTPLLHTKHVLQGTETHRIFLAIYNQIKDGTWKPWAAYTVQTQQQRHEEKQPTKSEFVNHEEWVFTYSKEDQITYYHSPGGGGALPSLTELTKGFPCGVWIDPEAFAGLRICDSWYPSLKAGCARALAEYATQPDALNVTYFKEPPGLLGSEITNPFGNGPGYESNEGQTIYCSKCDDHLNDDNDNPCEHIRWCEKCQQQTGPGLEESERCACGPNGACDLCETPIADGAQLYCCDKCQTDVCTACSHNAGTIGIECDNCHDDD